MGEMDSAERTTMRGSETRLHADAVQPRVTPHNVDVLIAMPRGSEYDLIDSTLEDMPIERHEIDLSSEELVDGFCDDTSFLRG